MPRTRKNKFVPQAITAVVLLGIFLGLMALRHPSPLKAPQIVAGSAISNSLFFASNQEFAASFGERNTNQPVIDYSLPTGNKVSFTFKDTKGKLVAPVEKNNAITFSNVSPNIDLKYTTLPTGIKEEIVLKKQTTNNIFNFDLNTTNAFPASETNILFSGVFYDTKGNYLFHFEKPFAIDANGAKSNNVSIQIKKNTKTNTYSLTLSVDKSWLESKSRVYPITIDPTIVHNTSTLFSTSQFNRVKDSGSGSNPFLETYYQELPSDISTIGLWHMNESSGTTTVTDSSGLGNTGTSNSSTDVGLGNFGSARTFNGSSDFINAGSNINLANSSFTLEAWAKKGANGIISGIMGQGTNANNAGLQLGFRATNVFFCGFFSNDLDSTASYTDTLWHHWACTYDANSKSRILYVDGQTIASGIASANYSGTGQLNVGAMYSSPTNYFNGSIDEVRISNIARSAEEIKLDASRRPYSVLTSDVLDLTRVFAWSPFKWTAFGLSTGDGETATASATSNLVAEWDFNASSGTTAVSGGTCGTTCNGALNGFANTTGQDVVAGSGWTGANLRWGTGAIMFDGTNDYVEVPDTPALNLTTAGTIELWIKRNAAQNYPMFVTKGASTEYEVMENSTTGRFAFRWGADAGEIISNAVIPIGQWTHLVAIYDGAHRYLYINGELDNSDNYSTNAVANASPVRIGARTDGFYTNATIDTVRIYNRALTPSEVLSNYNSGLIDIQTRVGNTTDPNDGTWEAWRPTTSETQFDSMDGPYQYNTVDTGLVSYWPMDDASGATATDVKSSNNGTATGTIIGGGKFGNGRNFNGTSDYVNAGNPATLQITGALSIEAWIKTNAVANWGGIVGKMGTGGGGQFGYLLREYNTGVAEFGISSNGTLFTDVVGTTTINDGQWHHIVGTYVPSTSLNIYVDGVLQNTNSTSIPAAIFSSSAIVNIGSTYSTPSEFFRGTIDEVRVYNTTISSTTAYVHFIEGSTNPNLFHPSIDTVTKVEGSASEKVQLGIPQTDATTSGLWHFEETGGTGAYLKDSSGKGNDGTPTGTTVVDGFAGKARSFNGAGDTISVSSNMSIGSGNYTLETWVYVPSISDKGAFIKIGGTFGPSMGVGSGTEDASGNNLIMLYETVRWIDTGVTIGTGWHHVAMVVSSSGYPSAYLDGNLVYTDTGAAPGAPDTSTCNIGGYGSRLFTGYLDEMKVSTIARTPQEIAEDYRAGRDHYINKQYSSTDLSSKTTLPFYIASDRLGTFLNATIGESIFANQGTNPSNTAGLWHLDDNSYFTPVSASGGTTTSISGGYTYQTFTSSGTFTVATGGNVWVYAIGGGGGGGGSGGTNTWAGSGGAGGAAATDRLTVAPGTYTVTVGNGGLAGTTTTGGGTGGTSTFGSSLVSAQGGVGGGVGAASPPAGGAGSSSSSTGDYVYRGGNGGTPLNGTKSGAGGGGAGTGDAGSGSLTGGIGGDASVGTAGTGTSTNGGTGGAGVGNANAAGLIGNTYGGGGSGGYRASASQVGGTGGKGIVIVAYPTSGDTAVDSSGHDNDGVAVGSSFVQGQIGRARYFNGTTDFLTTNNLTGFGTGNVTHSLDLWIKPDATPTTRQWPVLLGDAGAGNEHWTWNNDGLLHIGVYGGGQCTVKPSLGVWNYVAVTFDGTNLLCYLDGILVSQNTAVFAFTGVSLKLAKAQIGEAYFAGAIDEVRLSTTARIADAIRQAFELGARTHNITIDFKASLDAGNLITNSSDLSFIVNESAYGSYLPAGHLYLGDKIIVEENNNGTSYIAQGTVNSINAFTGAVTVSSWDGGSTFPASGFTANAIAFKWQREYFNITKSIASQRNAITYLTLRTTDGSQGANIWLDDLESTSGYLNTPSGSAITSSLTDRYFQYRTIISQNDPTATSSALNSITLNYTTNVAPNIPSLDAPSDTATNQSLLPVLQTTTTDPDGDNIKYKILLCTNSLLTIGCQTFDQSVSTTGWSLTSYGSGVQGVYTVQSALSPATTYYWDSQAIDPTGTNTFGGTQATPFSFTTGTAPNAPSALLTDGVTNNPTANIANIYFSATYSDPNSLQANFYRIEVNTNNTFTGTVKEDSTKTSFGPLSSGSSTPNFTYSGSALTTSTTYYWRITLWNTAGFSATSATAQFTTNTSPVAPTLISPSNSSTGITITPAFTFSSTDADAADYIRYKIIICTDFNMTLTCQTHDETLDQTGFSGQNASGSTAYTSGTTATYTLTSPLSAGTIYYWQVFAIDPIGVNVFSSGPTPFSFTTKIAPVLPAPCSTIKASNNTNITINWTDNSTNENFYQVWKIIDGGTATQLGSNLAANTVQLVDSAISLGHTYTYQIRAGLTDGSNSIYSDYCSTATSNDTTGSFQLKGLKLRGVKIN